MRMKKPSNKSILFFLLGMYVILPDYFKIAGQNSSLVVCAVIIMLFLLYKLKSGIRIQKLELKYSAVYLLFAGIMHIIHREWSQAIRIILENCILFFVVSNLLETKEDCKQFIKVIVGFAIFEAITTYIHFFTDFNVFSLLQSANLPAYTLDSATQYRMGMSRVEGSFGHAITYAVYISICACLCLFLYNNEKNKKYLYYYFICVGSLVMSISRMPILVFAASQMIYLFSINFKKTVNIIFKILAWSVPTITVMALIVPEVLAMLTSIVELVADVFSATGLSGLTTYEYNSAFTYRAEMLRVLPELISESPLFGIGGGQYRSDSFYFLINGTKQTSIDNAYFHCLLLYGIWGLIGLLWWLFAPLFLDKAVKEKLPKELTLRLYKYVIIFVYALNLFSVAKMFEYKLIIVIFAIFFADIRFRKAEGVR